MEPWQLADILEIKKTLEAVCGLNKKGKLLLGFDKILEYWSQELFD